MTSSAMKWTARGGVATGAVLTAVMLAGFASPAAATPTTGTPVAATASQGGPDRTDETEKGRGNPQDLKKREAWERCLRDHGVKWDPSQRPPDGIKWDRNETSGVKWDPNRRPPNAEPKNAKNSSPLGFHPACPQPN